VADVDLDGVGDGNDDGEADFDGWAERDGDGLGDRDGAICSLGDNSGVTVGATPSAAGWRLYLATTNSSTWLSSDSRRSARSNGPHIAGPVG